MKRNALLFAFVLLSPSLSAQTSRVGWWTVDGGFGSPASSKTMVRSALGQVIAGRSVGVSSVVDAGFLADSLFRVVVTGMPSAAGVVPTTFMLHQNYPNPFNPATTIRFELPQAKHVLLRVYNVLGQEVSTLVNEERSAGVYDIRFDVPFLASGMYVYRLQAGDFVAVKKMLILK
jgi:hypothetical protein